MRLSLLNLISTPLPVLNSLGLNPRVGLSSEDPMVTRHPSEPYDAYLSIYSPEGVFLERTHLGVIPPHRRRFFDITGITRRLVPHENHLSVVHRVPSRLLAQVSDVAEEIDLPTEPDYSFFRSLVEFSFPQGGNGSIIYETTPRMNAAPSSNTLTFTNQIVVSPDMNSYLVLINYSVDPSYSRIGEFFFGVHCISGQLAVADTVRVGPFGIGVLDMKQVIPEAVIEREMDPQDGLSSFTIAGGSDGAALMNMVVNAAADQSAVAIEHTHPPQTYLLPRDPTLQRQVKTQARSQWQSIVSVENGGQHVN